LGNLQGVGQSGDIVITQGGNEDLGLVLQAAKGFAVNNAVSVALEGGAHGAGLLRFKSPLRQPALHGIRGKGIFPLFQPKTNIAVRQIHCYLDSAIQVR
jgi:hypothetical protein